VDDTVIKYITINGTLYRIDEYSYRGYADSIHTTSTMTKVPEDEVEKIKRMVAEKGEKIEERQYRTEIG